MIFKISWSTLGCRFSGSIMPHELTSHRHFCRWETAAERVMGRCSVAPFPCTLWSRDGVWHGGVDVMLRQHPDTKPSTWIVLYGGWGEAGGKALLPAHLLWQVAYSLRATGEHLRWTERQGWNSRNLGETHAHLPLQAIFFPASCFCICWSLTPQPPLENDFHPPSVNSASLT